MSARYGPWAVVADASQGLGAAFAEDLARRNMNVVLVAHRGQLLDDVAGRLRAAHKVDVRCVTLDLACADFAVKIADAAADIDLGIVIYNAARIPIGSFLDMDEDVLEQVERVNVRGPLLLARTLLPAMRERGRGAVLLIEVMPPECEHRNVQVNNYWMESLDYRYHTIHTNKKLARYEDDGSVRLVVAHRDPGLPNWLETAGHTSGTMCFRWIKASEHPEPGTRVVNMSELEALRSR